MSPRDDGHTKDYNIGTYISILEKCTRLDRQVTDVNSILGEEQALFIVTGRALGEPFDTESHHLASSTTTLRHAYIPR